MHKMYVRSIHLERCNVYLECLQYLTIKQIHCHQEYIKLSKKTPNLRVSFLLNNFIPYIFSLFQSYVYKNTNKKYSYFLFFLRTVKDVRDSH